MPHGSQQESELSHGRHAYHDHDEAVRPYLKLPTEPFVARMWWNADLFSYRDNITVNVDVPYAGGIYMSWSGRT
jgi:hypothetical protein